MFVAYAEDSRLLPLNVNGEYTRHALKTIARSLSETINGSQNLGFDNPLTEEVEEAADTTQTYLWDECRALFKAVREGEEPWGVPAYNGGLFSKDPNVNLVGEIIEGLTLTNAEFGPALTALIVDKSPDGVIGPIDFRSLSVREFGTIYEGLLESDLSVAEQPLTINSDGVYLPARRNDDVLIEVGEVYIHNQSGVRKSTGSYFTKPFAVDHLISQSVDPILDEHLERVGALVSQSREADAAEMLFDFRVADIAMGSGHFLTAGKQVSDQPFTVWNRALAYSGLNGLPVRVVRGAGHDSPYSPGTGYSYEGLYSVDDYWHETGRSGFRVWRYRLTKLPDPLDEGKDEQSGTGSFQAPSVAPRRETTVLRIVRDTKQARRIKELYDYRCQMCGTRLEGLAGPYAEAAHIRPLRAPHHGPDTWDNILCLCPNHHVLFDHGGEGIGENLSLAGEEGRLEVDPQHRVSEEHLRYRRKHYQTKG